MREILDEYGSLLLSAFAGMLMLVLLYGIFLAENGQAAGTAAAWIAVFL